MKTPYRDRSQVFSDLKGELSEISEENRSRENSMSKPSLNDIESEISRRRQELNALRARSGEKTNNLILRAKGSQERYASPLKMAQSLMDNLRTRHVGFEASLNVSPPPNIYQENGFTEDPQTPGIQPEVIPASEFPQATPQTVPKSWETISTLSAGSRGSRGSDIMDRSNEDSDHSSRSPSVRSHKSRRGRESLATEIDSNIRSQYKTRQSYLEKRVKSQRSLLQEKEELKSQLEEKDKEIESLKELHNQEESNQNKLQTEYMKLCDEVKELTTELESKKSEIKKVNAELHTSKSEQEAQGKAETEKQLQILRQTMEIENEKCLEAERKKVDELTERLAEKQQELDEKTECSRKELEAERGKVDERLAKKQQEVDEITEELAKKQKEVELLSSTSGSIELEESVAELRQSVKTLRDEKDSEIKQLKDQLRSSLLLQKKRGPSFIARCFIAFSIWCAIALACLIMVRAKHTKMGDAPRLTH